MMQDNLLSELNTIVSEGRNSETRDIDTWSTYAILDKINDEDGKVAAAVRLVLEQITLAVDNIVTAFNNGGRLIYLGAGTSGRLGILDAVECIPTFNVGTNMVIGLIAGGDKAMACAVEGAEDDQASALNDLRRINFSPDDVLVGIAASGRTPYVIAGLQYAVDLGAKTVALSCNPHSLIAAIADIDICAVVGPEVLTGSTRMKSGTAQKLILNMLSTASMIRFGKTYQNLMVDLRASNEKLYARAIRIVMQATDCDQGSATTALVQAGREVKVAILMILTDTTADEAKESLNTSAGFLRQAVQKHQP
ncbi:MAG: N-acetylmuramic acid 6-phosphate etherase [Paraglaciecola sp.]|jgi:N-acetylmuramic acid 6-phosphate etherase